MTPPQQINALGRLVAHLLSCNDPVPPVLQGVHDLPQLLVRTHGLGPLSYQAGFDCFRHDYLVAAAQSALREQRLAELLDVLGQHGVSVVLLKGISYCQTIYADPAQRPMGDIDILVASDRHALAVRALRQIGYREISDAAARSAVHHAITLVRGECQVDVHRNMIQPLRSSIRLRELWDRARPAQERTDGALRLDPADEALLHLVNIARNQLAVPCINYVDAARLLRRLDPEQRAAVEQRARAYRVGRAVAAATNMVEALGGRGWPGTRGPLVQRVLLPGTDEILRSQPPGRWLQIARKLMLLQGPGEWAGLALVFAAERMAARLGRRPMGAPARTRRGGDSARSS